VTTALMIGYGKILIWTLRVESFSKNLRKLMLNKLNILSETTFENIENVEEASKILNKITEKNCNYELLQR
jgi:hypothetical protein